MKTLILTLISVSLVNNVVLSQFLGLCPFLGVSKQTKTALSMGGAVIFVITIASAVTHVLYRLLVLLHVEYLETVTFILIIAALVQLVELFLKKYSTALYNALGVYLPLITTNCAVLGVALTNVQNHYNFITSVVAGFGTALDIWYIKMCRGAFLKTFEKPLSAQEEKELLIMIFLMYFKVHPLF